MTRRLFLGLSLLAVLGFGAAALTAARSGPLPHQLQAVRAAVAKYHSYDQALAAGNLLLADAQLLLNRLGALHSLAAPEQFLRRLQLEAVVEQAGNVTPPPLQRVQVVVPQREHKPDVKRAQVEFAAQFLLDIRNARIKA